MYVTFAHVMDYARACVVHVVLAMFVFPCFSHVDGRRGYSAAERYFKGETVQRSAHQQGRPAVLVTVVV